MIVNYIDLGVHFGDEIDLLINQYSKLSSKIDLHIYGIEANNTITPALKEKYSDYSDIIQIYNYAITDHDNSVVNLYLTDNNYLGSSIYKSKRNVTDSYVACPTIKLSTFISRYVKDFDSSINVLKLNIEGSELTVYKDLIKTNLINKFKLFCGHPSHDIEKIPELYFKRAEYYNIINEYNLNLKYFCAEASIEKCINVFNELSIL